MNGRLGVLREPQVVFGALKDQLGERETEASSASAKVWAATGKRSAKFAAHANGLRTLPRKEESDFG
jgi:hypothetical protein